MHRAIRVAVVLLVMAVMSYLTWQVHRHYWRRDSYRVITPGVLYVLRDLDADLLQRFRSRFGEVTLVDLRSESERSAEAAGPGPAQAELRQLALVQELPVPAGQMPETEQVVNFLKWCADNTNHPLMLFAGLPPAAGESDVRIACLEAAYRYVVLEEPLEEALLQVAGPGGLHESDLRRALRDAREAWSAEPAALGPAAPVTVPPDH